MKRAGHLIEKIAGLENLQLAYYKAQKGKADKKEVIEYGKRLQVNLQNLQAQILSGEVETGHYRYFTIYDPKKRLICAAPFGQRVLHHALMNVCHPFFEKVQIFDSYASRLDKGTYAALARAKRFNRQHQWFLKLDFRKYFDSLDHAVIKNQLHARFKDSRLLNIFERIIDSYQASPNKGVPIGNLTSQYFANHYLAGADHYVKEVLQIKAFIRYMDDSVLWHDDKARLMTAGLSLKEFAAAELELILKPFCLNRNSHGLPFLGYLLYPGRTRLALRSRKRFVKKLRLYAENLISGAWTQQEYQAHVLPLIAFTEHAEAKEFRRKVIAQV
jgi:retron-type reverse transcriptase